MRYLVIPGEPDAVVWLEGSDSGVTRDGDAGWDAYQAWLSDGHVPEQKLSEQITQETAIAMVEREFGQVCAALRGTHTQAEIDSWPQQVAEAKAFFANENALTPLIDGMALPHEEKEELCHKVILKSEKYNVEMGALLMWRRIAVAAVEAMFEHGPRNQFHVQYPEVPSAS